ncbi:MAG: hypothetical protein WBE78_10030 [Candidatus Binataceae bacterium]
MARLKLRLNSLAIQHAAFRVLATVLIAGAVIFVAANWISPLYFLGASAVVSIVAIAAIVNAVRAGFALRASAVDAAQIADQRANLKGRLATIVEVAARPNRGTLWPYVVEDALAHREEFAAKRIERRRVERSIWILGVAMIAAAVMLPLARMRHPSILAQAEPAADMTIDLDDLHLRPADSGDSGGLEVQADSSTMSRLQAKLAQEGVNAGAAGGHAQGGIVNSARNLAQRIQNKLRGEQPSRKQRLTLKLADAGGDQASNPRGDESALRRQHRQGEAAGQFKREHSFGDEDIPLPKVDETHGPRQQQSVGGNEDLQTPGRVNPENAPDADSAPDTGDQRGNLGSSGGPSHGIGADPDSLFGAATKSPMSTEGFEISIEARAMAHGAKGAGQAYLPPKVRTPLSSSQQADEPIARAAVPAEDRTTIERVFER